MSSPVKARIAAGDSPRLGGSSPDTANGSQLRQAERDLAELTGASPDRCAWPPSRASALVAAGRGAVIIPQLTLAGAPVTV